MSRRRLCTLAALLCAASCAPPPAAPLPDAAPDGPPPPARCRPAPGVSAAPRTIIEVAALANALPHPLTLTCFLESLERPLEVNLAVSTISLQPAPSPRSPRIFLFSGDVILSVVPAGTGKDLLEMGQLVSEDRTVKAELKFPIVGQVAPDDPFAHVRSDEGTTCRFCHPAETHAPEISPSAYVSGAFSPLPRAQLGLETWKQEHAACDPAAEPERCAFLRALFDHGEVRGRNFPATVPTAFDRR